MKSRTTHTKKMGRPKEKVSDKVDYDQLAMLCAKGFTDIDLAKFYKVTESTINNWKKSPDFFCVLKENKEIANAMVEASLFQRACGYSHPAVKIFMTKEGSIVEAPYIEHYPPDATSLIFWLKNRDRENWKDRREYDMGINSDQVEALKKRALEIMNEEGA